jgi:hypothetical protein
MALSILCRFASSDLCKGRMIRFLGLVLDASTHSIIRICVIRVVSVEGAGRVFAKVLVLFAISIYTGINKIINEKAGYSDP